MRELREEVGAVEERGERGLGRAKCRVVGESVGERRRG